MTTAEAYERERSDARESQAWLMVAVAAFVAFAILTLLVASRTVLPFDQPILGVARSWDALTPFWRFVSDAANLPMIAVGIGLVGWLLLAHRHREAVLVVILLAVATIGSEIVKEIVARPRPIRGPEIGVVYSYASGHVLEALTILGIIAILAWRSRAPHAVRVLVAVLVVAFVVLVALSRMALGEHYPSDVLGGALAGIGMLALFAGLTTPQAARPMAESRE